MMKLWLDYVVYLSYENMESNGNLIKSINTRIKIDENECKWLWDYILIAVGEVILIAAGVSSIIVIRRKHKKALAI